MKKIWIWWIISLVLCAACITTNFVFFRVENIIKIEFAPSPDAMRNYIEGIDASSRENSYRILEMNTIIDFVFIVGYTMLTFFSFKVLVTVFELSTAGWVYVTTFLTGFFDCLENIFLMNSGIRQREDFSWLYYDIVRIKWAFAVIPFLVISVVTFYALIVLFRTRK